MTKTVTPVGRSAYSVLNEAVGWKGAETNKKFIQRIAFSKADGEAVLSLLKAEAERLFAMEVEKAKAKGQSGRMAQAPINYREDGGEILITFQRKEEDGPPTVLDADNKVVTTRVPRDAGVQAAYTVRPYVMNNTFGISLALQAVKVATTSMSVEAAAALFGDDIPTPKPGPKAAAKEDDINDLF